MPLICAWCGWRFESEYEGDEELIFCSVMCQLEYAVLCFPSALKLRLDKLSNVRGILDKALGGARSQADFP